MSRGASDAEAPIEIPDALRRRIYAHARRCYPAECCGYLIGSTGADTVDAIVECRNAQPDGDHPIVPARDADTGYVIAGAELIAFANTFRGDRPARVVYHSHTNGRAYFSAVDRDSAAPPFPGEPPSRAYPVQHLVVGITAGALTEAAQFGWSDAIRDHVEIARWTIDGGSPS